MGNEEQEKISSFILNRIINDVDDYKILKALLLMAEPAQKILKLKSYEELTFHPNKNGVQPVEETQIERLSMVQPPSFECSIRLKLFGYFKIKYKSSGFPLPVPVESFEAVYKGILTQNGGDYSIKNETVVLPENLILQ
jgi:hypothetical protein